jgi:serine/threonine protein kinase
MLLLLPLFLIGSTLGVILGSRYQFDPYDMLKLKREFQNSQVDTRKFLDSRTGVPLRAFRARDSGKIFVMSSKRHPYFHENVGKGTYGTVKVAQDIDTGEFIAIKRPNKARFTHGSASEYIVENRYLPSNLKVSNLVYAKAVNDKLKPYMLMKKIDGKPAYGIFADPNATPQTLKKVLGDMYNSLAELHSQGIVHRDAHPGNFIIDKQGRAQIIDMGMAKAADPQLIRLDRLDAKASWALILQMRGDSNNPEILGMINRINADIKDDLNRIKLDDDIYIENLIDGGNAFPHLKTYIKNNEELKKKFLSRIPVSVYLQQNLDFDSAIKLLRQKAHQIYSSYQNNKPNVDPSLDRTVFDINTGRYEVVKRPNSPQFKGPGNMVLDQLESTLWFRENFKKNSTPDNDKVLRELNTRTEKFYAAIFRDKVNADYFKQYASDYPILNKYLSKSK